MNNTHPSQDSLLGPTPRKSESGGGVKESSGQDFDLGELQGAEVPNLPCLLQGLDALGSSLGLGPSARDALRRAAISIASAPPTILGHPTLASDDGEGPILHLGQPPNISPPRGATLESPSQDPLWPGNLVDLGRVGMGGLGEVRRVLDRDLNRVMVMKLLRVDIKASGAGLGRFLEEAQVTAQLQHPGIVPVHGFGQLEDGRVFFTMKEIKGRTLDEVISQAYQGNSGPTEAELWQMVDVFRRICDAVAYAHSRGIIHRDLKPSNVMVGPFGEVLVLDWGLAKVIGSPEEVWLDDGAVVTGRSSGNGLFTQVGAVIGTPAFMAPEQARGQIDRLGPPTDVYALGATLFQILTGRAPFGLGPAMEVLRRVLEGPPGPSAIKGEWVSPALRSICLRAMAREMDARYEDASALGEDVAAFLEGAKARERARAEVERAEAILPRISRLRERAEALREGARERLSVLPPSTCAEDKEPGWFLEDEAERCEQEAELYKLAFLQNLRTALNHDANHRDAHFHLAAFYRSQHEIAEANRDRALASQFEMLVRAHDRGEHRRYLQGVGRLTLPVEVPCVIKISAYQVKNRRWTLEFQEAVKVDSLLERELPVGSYLLECEAPGYHSVRYPVFIERLEHCRPQAPGGGPLRPLALLPQGTLGPDDVLIPEGSFIYGGDSSAYGSGPRERRWLDTFVMRRFPVTNGEYLIFLNDLVSQGRIDEALEYAPRERGCTEDGPGPLLYGQAEDGHFYLRADPDGDVWQFDWPVLMVNWYGARAFTRWLAGRTGRPWQLPTEAMWEKAARGVDGRYFPWGDFLDPSWANVRGSHEGGSPIKPIGSYPIDESPFGVRGVAGNALDWCLDTLRDDRPGDVSLSLDDDPDRPDTRERVWRGGSFGCSHRSARLAKRDGGSPLNRDYDLGFRIARWLP